MKTQTYVLVEKTSKQWKGQLLLSYIAMVLGIMLLIGGSGKLGILAIFAGSSWYWVTRLNIWWNHA